ncbi:MAG: HAMP domain-containing histidine kinase [Anaerolineae bacterium]|nr:HAMP domain-containing histidine kinase [Anaerolineae bacterium]
MFRSIRWRLVTSFILITVLTAGLVGVLALSLLRRAIEHQELAYLTSNAEGLARQVLPLLRPVLRDADLRDLVEAAAFLGGLHIRVLDAGQEALADSDAGREASAYLWVTAEAAGLRVTPYGLLPVRIPVPGMMHANRGVIVVRRAEQLWGGRFILDDSYHVEWATTHDELERAAVAGTAPVGTASAGARHVTVPVGEDDDLAGYVEVSKDAAAAREALTTARRAVALASAGAVSLAAVVGLWVSARLAAPVRTLTAVADRMTNGDLSARAPAGGRDETGQLSRQFNRMADQMQSSFVALGAERDALRRFVADASHELRTPITALRTFNELLQDGADLDATTRDGFLAESAAQIARLGWITGHLLDLTRLDGGLAALELTRCTAASLLEDAAVPFRIAARDKGLVLTIALPDPALGLVCDRARVVLAVSNLLDNAVKFTPPGGLVEAGTESNPESVSFWVRDTGPGIPAAEQAHVFDRFYRGSTASSQAEGSGLGLAIVRAVAEAHGGSVAVESAEGAGSCFRLTLPHR